MGNITVNSGKKLTTFGSKKVSFGTLSPSSSYATGGESYTANKFQFGKILKLYVFPSGGYMAEVDHDNKKVKILGQRADSTSSGVIKLEEVSSGSDLSSQEFPYIAIGY